MYATAYIIAREERRGGGEREKEEARRLIRRVFFASQREFAARAAKRERDRWRERSIVESITSEGDIRFNSGVLAAYLSAGTNIARQRYSCRWGQGNIKRLIYLP